MQPRRGRLAALVLLGPLALAACASSSAQTKINLTVTPASDTNDRLPCYLLVRQVDPRAYVSDSYQSIASMVMTPDDSVVASALVFPGTAQSLALAAPSKGQLAVYVLFTYPNGEWKTLLPSAASPLEIKLDQSRLYPPAAK
jgi:hypothetical protein